MEHDGCKGCKYEKCSEDSKECRGCKQNAVDKYTKMTQADRIRSMSDEELAEFLSESTNCDCCNIQCPDKLNCPSMSSCYCRHLEWLQSEVEEEAWEKYQRKQ